MSGVGRKPKSTPPSTSLNFMEGGVQRSDPESQKPQQPSEFLGLGTIRSYSAAITVAANTLPRVVSPDKLTKEKVFLPMMLGGAVTQLGNTAKYEPAVVSGAYTFVFGLVGGLALMGAKHLHQAVQSTNRIHELESGPQAEKVCSLLIHLLEQLPEERREQMKAMLETDWNKLREPFFQLVGDDPTMQRSAALQLSRTEINQLLEIKAQGVNAADIHSKAFEAIEMLCSTSMPGLEVLNSGEVSEVGEFFVVHGMSEADQLCRNFWLSFGRMKDPLVPLALIKEVDAGQVAANALATAGVPSYRYENAIQIASRLATAEGEKMLENFEKLSPKAVKLAQLIFLSQDISMDWGKAYAAIGSKVLGNQFRKELIDAGLMDNHGLTLLGRDIVKAKTSSSVLEKLSTKHGAWLGGESEDVNAEPAGLRRRRPAVNGEDQGQV